MLLAETESERAFLRPFLTLQGEASRIAHASTSFQQG